MTMTWEFESVLEQSLTQIAAGKARVESCLLAYPAMADELEPLLRTAESLRTLPKPELAPEARARIEGELLAAVAGNPRFVAARRPRRGFVLPRWQVPRWAINALTLVLALVVALTAVVGASADALPDSVLYRVKLASEDAWLWLTPARSEPSLHLQLARRRLAEVEAMAEEGVFDGAVLDAMAKHIDAALTGAADLPPALALPLLDEVSEFLTEQQEVLVRVADQVPADAAAQVDHAVQESAAFVSRVESLRAYLKANGTPSAPPPTGSRTPTALPGRTGVEMPTAIPAATEAGAANVTPSLAPTATATGTATPAFLASPEPTRREPGPAPTGTEPAAAVQATDTPEPSGPPAWGVTREPGEPTVPARGLTKTPKPKDDSGEKDAKP